MNRHEYEIYLRSDEWNSIRQSVLMRASYQCEQCMNAGRLHVHHLTYERVGNENEDDLIVLCEDCHNSEHPEKHLKPSYL